MFPHFVFLPFPLCISVRPEPHYSPRLLLPQELQACLNLAAEKMKEVYGKGTAPTYEVGDMVFLDARNIKEKIQTKDKPTRAMVKKLRPKRIGPYKVLEKVGELNYRLDLPVEMTRKGVHDVFHVTLLLKKPEDQIAGRKPVQPPPVIVDSEEELEVKEILDSRMNRTQLQYLV